MNLPNGYSKARLYINDEDFEGGGRQQVKVGLVHPLSFPKKKCTLIS